ncbi:MAG: glycoside hydrolase family 3 N-terminal domain-containing protein [Flavobacteriales bacterium]
MMKIKKQLTLFLGLFLFFFSCNTIKNSTSIPQIVDSEIEAIISKMTIEQKVGQMTQINIDVISKGEIYNLEKPHQLDSKKLDSAINHYFVGSILNVGGHTYTRAHWQEIITQIQTKATTEGNKIPIIYGIDAIHGVNYTVDATLFPQQIGQAATWNLELVKEGASITAYECRASGIPWNFSPVLDIGRQPLWSRFFETYGEDVYLAKQMTEACIIGYQGNDPSNPEKVASCMKHFLGYSTPLSGKDRTPVWIPKRQLREYYLPTFETAIKENALTVMINSGEINGIPVHANPDLLTKLLRDELGFKGLAVTDWEDIIKLYKNHNVAKDMREAVKLAVNAGIDMSMTPNDYSFNKALIDLVKSGEVKESRLDESCRRILWVKKQLGLLKNPIPDFARYTKFASKEFKETALNTALESITLLKNENNVLPLKKEANILICGPAANSLNIQNGAWTHTWQGVDPTYNTKGAKTYYEAIKQISKGKVEFSLGSGLDSLKNLEETIEKAKKSDVIIVCLGELPCTEIPGNIEDLTLPKAQQRLVKELSKLNKPIVFTLTFNRPRIINEIVPNADAILHCYLPGDFGGEALAKILFGGSNPSGKIPFTYPRFTGSFIQYDHKYTEVFDINFGKKAFNPQWEFGFGMSYSNFNYDEVNIDKLEYSKSDTIKVSLEIKNTSNREGKEVVQVYISDKVASITPSVKRLRGFRKVNLSANSTKKIEFRIPVSELAFVGVSNTWELETGGFQLEINGIKRDFLVK